MEKVDKATTSESDLICCWSIVCPYVGFIFVIVSSFSVLTRLVTVGSVKLLAEL
uniref:Uncharacterized protein n=1 Tax=Arundo donax TaxID=35708 RepID=A0A0A9A953_ARUDO